MNGLMSTLPDYTTTLFGPSKCYDDAPFLSLWFEAVNHVLFLRRCFFDNPCSVETTDISYARWDSEPKSYVGAGLGDGWGSAVLVNAEEKKKNAP